MNHSDVTRRRRRRRTHDARSRPRMPLRADDHEQCDLAAGGVVLGVPQHAHGRVQHHRDVHHRVRHEPRGAEYAVRRAGHSARLNEPAGVPRPTDTLAAPLAAGGARVPQERSAHDLQRREVSHNGRVGRPRRPRGGGSSPHPSCGFCSRRRCSCGTSCRRCNSCGRDRQRAARLQRWRPRPLVPGSRPQAARARGSARRTDDRQRRRHRRRTLQPLRRAHPTATTRAAVASACTDRLPADVSRGRRRRATARARLLRQWPAGAARHRRWHVPRALRAFDTCTRAHTRSTHTDPPAGRATGRRPTSAQAARPRGRRWTPARPPPPRRPPQATRWRTPRASRPAPLPPQCTPPARPSPAPARTRTGRGRPQAATRPATSSLRPQSRRPVERARRWWRRAEGVLSGEKRAAARGVRRNWGVGGHAPDTLLTRIAWLFTNCYRRSLGQQR